MPPPQGVGNATNSRTINTAKKSNDTAKVDSEESRLRRPINPLQANSTNITTSQPAEGSGKGPMTSPSPSKNHPPIQSPLFTKLTMAMRRALDLRSRSFLPQDQLDALTPRSVKEELKRAMPTLPEPTLDEYTANIFTNNATTQAWSEQSELVHVGQSGNQYFHKKKSGLPAAKKFRLLRTFTILILIDKVQHISSFIVGGFTDSLLPLNLAYFSAKKVYRHIFPSLIALLEQCFENWPMSNIEAFVETQWLAISPFLNRSKGDVSLYNFNAHAVLPIYIDNTIPKPHVKMGGYSIVRKVKIHTWHHDFEGNTDQLYFALKELRSHRLVDFQRELAALRPFAVSPHLHIVNLLAAFRHGTSFYFLFPWAEGGSLHSFWQENPNPVLDSYLSKWIIEQCLGIAIALHQIHRRYYSAPPDESNDRGSFSGRHGDIKPENILLFKQSSRSDNFVWALGDFGLGRLHGLTSGHENDRPTGFSPTYRAPELDLIRTVGSAYDIWSLGCVFLELLTWLLCGWEGVGSFASSRVSPDKEVSRRQWNDDGFFRIIVPKPQGSPEAELKPSVILWMDNLAEDKAASPYINDLLSLTRDDLLDTNWKTRANSSLLIEKLQGLRQKCLDDPTYTVAMPRPHKPPWSKAELPNLDNYDFLAFESQTQPIQINTAQIPIPNKLNYTEPILLPLRETDQHNTMDYPYGIVGNGLFDIPGDALIPMENAPGSQQSYAMPSQSVFTTDQNLPGRLLGGTGSRRRRLDDITDPNEGDDKRRKRARKKGGLMSKDTSKDTPNIADQDVSQATTKGLLESGGAAKEKKLFACPFHKYNPRRYNTKFWKSCIGPGWNISRLKEHIYRKHYSSGFRCDRCLAEFENRCELNAHQRLESPCKIQNSHNDMDTIDEAQKAQIQKKPRNISDEQKWNEMYRIIFKLDSTAVLPSPYCDTIPSGAGLTGDDKPDGGNSLAEFETFLRRLECDNGQHDASAIRNCLDLVQRFQRGREEEQTVSETELGPGPVSVADIAMPSLTYDCTDDATRTSDSREAPSLASVDSSETAAPWNFRVADADDDLNGFPYWDSTFGARFNAVFNDDGGKSCYPLDQLDLNGWV
ncbi:hypothetical protein M426DRAFT_322521 [Hypoxylon sp. CI-4A]|nr:hypothetical protein M426DRAFT_322521 [Hypoxylon sp. CI-4A]